MECFQESENLKIFDWLYRNKKLIVHKFQILSENNDTRQIQLEIQELVSNLNKFGIFPQSPPSINTRKPSWLSDESLDQGFAVAKQCQYDSNYYWVVNYKIAQVHKAPKNDVGIFIEDYEHLTREAPDIFNHYIDRLVGDYPIDNFEED